MYCTVHWYVVYVVQVNKTMHNLQAVQTASEWLFYFLLMLCVLLSVFVLTALSSDVTPSG